MVPRATASHNRQLKTDWFQSQVIGCAKKTSEYFPLFVVIRAKKIKDPSIRGSKTKRTKRGRGVMKCLHYFLLQGAEVNLKCIHICSYLSKNSKFDQKNLCSHYLEIFGKNHMHWPSLNTASVEAKVQL